MVSTKSVIAFTSINGSLIAVAYLYSLFLHTNYLLFFIFLRNMAMVKTLDFTTRTKERIHAAPEGEFVGYVFQAAVIETATASLISSSESYSMPMNLVMFIPLSFIFEIVFDFFHYWTHRSLHMSNLPWHKLHHTHAHLKSVIAFQQDWVDLILTNSIPFLLTWRLVQSVYPLSEFELSMLITYKLFVEVSGHIGRKTSPSSSFPQCVWLPRFLGIELYGEDHSLHHMNPNFNFAKRFALWDKAFGTFRPAPKT